MPSTEKEQAVLFWRETPEPPNDVVIVMDV